MARRGKPLGNKRQREQAKARKKRDKEARRASKGAGEDDVVELGPDGYPIEPPAPEGEDATGSDSDPGAETESDPGSDPGTVEAARAGEDAQSDPSVEPKPSGDAGGGDPPPA